VECEGAPAVSVTLGVLPDVEIDAFHVAESDIPDQTYDYSPKEWR